MNDKISKILGGIASETFEGLAFMFGFPEEDENAGSGESMVVTAVGFQGPFSGRMIMAVTQQTVEELTANMLGLDEGEGEISPDDQADALKETVNVICGNLLPAIAGKDAVFDIHPPEILADGSSLEETSHGKLVSVAKLSIDDEPCHLSLYIDGQNSEAFMKLTD
ncbi:MAG: chemotaxis protein CheX [Deltaproteobacteria bacterium]|nr:chemotaxis protein CheX [Deltaproteobacteria bacterium]